MPLETNINTNHINYKNVYSFLNHIKENHMLTIYINSTHLTYFYFDNDDSESFSYENFKKEVAYYRTQLQTKNTTGLLSKQQLPDPNDHMLNIIATKPSFNLHCCEFIPVNISGLQDISIDTFLQELLQIARLDKNNEVDIDWTNMPLFNKQYLKENNISISTYRLLEMIYSALIDKKDISTPYFAERMPTCP